MGVGRRTKATGSPPTATPFRFLTVAVTADVLVPLAGMTAGLATTATVLGRGAGGFAVCTIVADPLPPEASTAVKVQNPTVVDEM
jgi:hypothetical protein